MKKKYKWSIASILIIVAMLFGACAAPVADTSEADAKIAALEAQLAEAAEAGISAEELAELQDQLTAAQDAATMEEAPSWAPLTMEDFTSADIDWQGPAKNGPAEGIVLHVAVLSHPYINALRPYVPLFEELTGIEVAYDILPVEEFWVKTAADMAGGTGFYDLVMTGTEFEWGWDEAGWLYDLNDFIYDPALTDLEWYDLDDFYPYDLTAHQWSGEYGIGEYGKGRQNAIPVNSEPLMLMCNKAILENAGLPGPPTTWVEWAEYAEAMTGDGNFGVVQRGARDYSLMYGYAPGFFAYSDRDLDDDLKPVFNCAACAEYTQLYGDTLRLYGPPGQTNIGWDGVIANMISGTVGCTVDDMAFVGDNYENPEASQVVGKMVYANPPAGPTGEIKIPVWQWSWSINSATSRPEAAWLFMQWATSSPVMTVASVQQRSMLPVRKSVWESPEIVEITKDWGNFREAIDASRPYWGNFYTVQPNMVAMTSPWVVAIQEVILGEKDAQTALNDAAVAAEKILADAGMYDE